MPDRETSYIAYGDFVHRTAPPLVISRSESATLIDEAGDRWIDLEAANGSALLGYDSRLVNDAAIEWKTLPALPSFMESRQRREYADRLGALLQSILKQSGHLAFELGGSQGIELAIRIAAANRPKRGTVVVLEGCYHGRSLALSHASSSLRYRSRLPPVGFRVVRLPVPAFQAKGGSSPSREDVQHCVSVARRVFLEEAMGLGNDQESDVYAFVFEPTLNVAGLVEPGSEFLIETCELARQVGAICIADEVFTGVHRLGPFLGCQHVGVTPDMVVLSKALTNGTVPLSAVWGRDPLMQRESWPPGSYSSTFSNNPLHFMIASRVLCRVESLAMGQIEQTHDFLVALTDVITRKPSLKAISGRAVGLTAYIEFESEADRDFVRSTLLHGAANDRAPCGIVTGSTGMSRRRILLHPPAIMTDEERATSIRAFELL